MCLVQPLNYSVVINQPYVPRNTVGQKQEYVFCAISIA